MTEWADSSQHGPICIPTGKDSIPDNASEDCLFLDVYAPVRASKKSKLLPVYVWIQGGGFNELSGPNFNATGLIQAADMDMVVVTLNYRVGAYGFLAGEQVKEGGSLNNGLKDQLKVLEWVQEHIKQFGGDPNHVVIGGASAGAGSVTLLLSAYGGDEKVEGLFHGAVAESQSFPSMRNTSTSQSIYDNLVIRTGCASDNDTLACLRGLDVVALQHENYNTPLPGAQEPALYIYGPTVDGDLVPDYTYRLFHQGQFLKVPTIFGDPTNEGTIFVPQNITDIGEADTFIQNEFPQIELDQLAQVNAWYLQPNQTRNFPNSGPYWRPTSNAYGEIRYTCPGIDMSTVAANANIPNWNYHYAVHDQHWAEIGWGVPHISEMYAIWGPEYVSTQVMDMVPASIRAGGSNAAIIPVLRGYWTSFVRALDPNPFRYPGSPEWKTWGSGEGKQRLFLRTNETRMETVSRAQKERCEFLVGIGVELRQ